MKNRIIITLYFLLIFQNLAFADPVGTWADLQIQVAGGNYSNIPLTNSFSNISGGPNVVDITQDGTNVDIKTYTISGANNTPIFNNTTNPGNFTILNGTLENGISTNGAAIYNSNTVTINTINFISNIANNDGGAIKNTGTMSISDSSFYLNTATYGGAINNFSAIGLLTASNLSFTNNTSTNLGGAICNGDSSTLNISDSSFDTNSALSGGGVYNSGIATLNGGSFSNNTSVISGGAIYDSNTATLNLTSTNFTNNRTTNGSGGAITNEGNSIITNASFTRNSATSGGGGAIYNGGTATLAGSTFQNNFATTFGGAIYNISGTLNVSGSLFSDNGINTGGTTVTNDGGAVYNTGIATINNSTSFTGNKALSDGGAIKNTGTMNITDSSFNSNTATYGGAVNNFSASGVLTASNLSFSNNTSTNLGGAICNGSSSTLNISNSSFDANSGGSTGGGAIYNEGNSTITNNSFTNNSATSGGAVYNRGTISSYSETYTTNSASTGGAIYNDAGGILTLTDSSFTNNTASVKGGAIYSNGGTIGINATGAAVTFSGNKQASSDNDISMTNSTNLNLTANTYDITLNGGIEGTGTINKLGSGNLNLSGNNTAFTGTYNNNAGKVTIKSAFFTGINNFTAGTAEIQAGGSMTLNSGDNWTGTNISTTGGDFTLGISHTTGGTYNQTLGALHIISASNLTLGTGSTISDGSVDFTGVGNLLNVATGGAFNPAATVSLSANNTFRISGGDATLNGTGTGIDTWAGAVDLSSGTLTINNLTNNAITGGVYNQSGGILNLIEGSVLTVNPANITGGEIDVSSTTATKSDLKLVYSSDATYNTNVKLQGNGLLTLDTNGHTVTNTSDTLITSTGIGNVLVKEGLGTYIYDLSGLTGNKQIDYGLNINQGIMNITGPTSGTLTFRDPINLGSGATNGTLNLNAPASGIITFNDIINSTSNSNIINVNTTGTGTVNFNSNILSTTLNINGGTTNFGENISLANDKLTISGGMSNFINQNFNTSNDIILTGGTMNLNSGNAGASYIQDKIIGSAGSAININKTVGSNPTDGTVYINNSITGGTDINLYNGTMALSDESYIDGNNLGIYGGTLNTQNGLIGTMALNNFNVGSAGGNWLMNVDLANIIGDKITSANPATGTGFLNISGINLLSDANALTRSVTVADANTKNHLSTSVTSVNGALFTYGVSYDGSGPNGVLNFVKTGVSPNAVTSDVSQSQAFLLQTAIDRQFFGNIDTFMSFPLAQRESSICCALANDPDSGYAGGACPLSGNGTFSPIYSCDLNKGIWIKDFVSFENIPLNNGPNVSTTEYATLIGADAPLKYLGHGIVGNTSTYIGYLGSNQSYDSVRISQNGGLIGVAENMVRGNTFLTLMSSVGSTLADAMTPYGTDHFSSLFTGAAAKGGHNFESKNGEYIIQPNLMLAYTFTHTPAYKTASGLSMNSTPLNAMQIAPGIRLIKNLKEKKGQVYLISNMVFNLMDKTNFTANDVQLPQLSINPYVEYGIGYQQVWRKRFTGFFQTLLRDGGRNGVALQFGFRWAI